MNITKELIERYHLGLCSEDEQEAVEAWLLEGDEESEELTSPDKEELLQEKKEIWANLTEQIPSFSPSVKRVFLFDYVTPNQMAAAASFLFLLGIGFLFYQMQNTPKEVASTAKVPFPHQISAKELDIVLGEKSKAHFVAAGANSSIDFCGTILIQPKQDVELTVQGTCPNPSGIQEKRMLKKGQNYVAVNYRSEQTSELIVVEEGDLINLPPLVQREIQKQLPI